MKPNQSARKGKNNVTVGAACMKVLYFFMYWYAFVLFVSLTIVVSLYLRCVVRSDITRSIAHVRQVFRVWIRVHLALTFTRLRTYGKHNQDPKRRYIIMANHRSLLDIFITTPFLRSPNITLGKDSFGKIPIFATIYKAGAILVNRQSSKSRYEAFLHLREVLQKEVCVCIYPEGTRNKGEEVLQKFQLGGFRLAVQAQTPILPVLLRYTDYIVPVRGMQYRPHAIHMHILPAVEVSENDTPESLLERTFTYMHREATKIFDGQKVL